MARPINTKLTKTMLEEMGIYNVYWDTENNEWWIDRLWYHGGSNNKTHKKVNISLAACKHKYTSTKVYPKVTFSYNMKTVSYPLARFIYAWFVDDIKDGEVIDHINNNPFDNSISNLRAVSVEENLRKRYLDNPKANHNQWDAKANKMSLEDFRKYLASHKNDLEVEGIYYNEEDDTINWDVYCYEGDSEMHTFKVDFVYKNFYEYCFNMNLQLTIVEVMSAE